MIVSSHNPKIQWIRKLQSQSRLRREQQVFIVEGVRLVEEALYAGWLPSLVIHTPDLEARGQRLLQSFQERGAPVEVVDSQVMRVASDTQAPQGILAVLPVSALPLPRMLDFTLVVDAVRDPGNLGTLLRTAAAAGAQAVLLSPGSADPYAPKVVRAGMGAHFKLPIFYSSWDEIRALLEKDERTVVYLADSRGGLPYTQADFRSPLSLLVGGEAEGAGAEALRLAHERVHIPMPGGSESLNVSVAAALLLFEVVRQREGH